MCCWIPQNAPFSFSLHDLVKDLHLFWFWFSTSNSTAVKTLIPSSINSIYSYLHSYLNLHSCFCFDSFLLILHSLLLFLLFLFLLALLLLFALLLTPFTLIFLLTLSLHVVLSYRYIHFLSWLLSTFANMLCSWLYAQIEIAKKWKAVSGMLSEKGNFRQTSKIKFIRRRDDVMMGPIICLLFYFKIEWKFQMDPV